MSLDFIDFLQLEDGSGSLLLETGDYLLLQSSIVSKGKQLQTAVYEIVEPAMTARGIGTHDEVPHMPKGMPAKSFPYVVIGDVQFIPFDTDDNTGWEAFMTFHIWSRARGKEEAYQIEQILYDALNRTPITLSGYDVFDALQSGSFTIQRDPDKKTIHGFGQYVFKAFTRA